MAFSRASAEVRGSSPTRDEWVSHIRGLSLLPVGGSSPRMWGHIASMIGDFNAVGFIPTHVGSPRPSCSPMSQSRVHPHACGVTGEFPASERVNKGSSPRMWGHLDQAWDRLAEAGFIPTHVGSPVPATSWRMTRRVHPHACGVTAANVGWLITTAGSSPRMWGHLRSGLPCFINSRFIPTHVGSPPPPRPTRRGSRVHPHACGVTCAYVVNDRVAWGSSPRMWGHRCQPSL